METNELAKALAAAQGEMKNATLNKINPHFKSKYADLAAVRDATIPALSKHGLAITQRTLFRDGNFLLVTRLEHSGGQFIESDYPLPLDVGKPQIMGSATTYARRYSWAALCGIAAEEDDDAEAAQTNGDRQSARGTAPKSAVVAAVASAMEPQNGEGGKATKEAWKGPLGRSELGKAAKAFANDLEACNDEDELIALVNSHKDLQTQIVADWPEAWYGDGGDKRGFAKRIEEIRNVCRTGQYART